jgi:hypothetical protein
MEMALLSRCSRHMNRNWRSQRLTKEPTLPGFGDRFAGIRQANGMTQHELRTAVDVSPRVIAYHESDDTQPPGAMLCSSISPARSASPPMSCSAWLPCASRSPQGRRSSSTASALRRAPACRPARRPQAGRRHAPNPATAPLPRPAQT